MGSAYNYRHSCVVGGILDMKDEIMSLLTDFGEFTLDMFLQDGIIKDIPIVGSGFSMVKISADIRDRIFMEKLKSFIENIEMNT